MQHYFGVAIIQNFCADLRIAREISNLRIANIIEELQPFPKYP